MRTRLAPLPILSHPDPCRQFGGQDAILSQHDYQKLHFCTFYSHWLATLEVNYNVGNRDLLVVVIALQEPLAGGVHPAISGVEQPQGPVLP